jgi:tetratricopeptide (TPR) repeat protein
MGKANRFLVCTAIALGTSLFAVADDRIYPKTGAAATGKITKVTPAEVSIEVRGKEQKFATNDISKITFNDEPKGLERGREQVLLKQYDQALEELKKLTPAGIENPLIVQDIEFYRWYCEGKLGLAGSGDKQAAMKGLLALATRNSSTHHLYELSEMLGELSLAINQPEKAISFFNMLLRAPSAETKASGVYRLGTVELELNKIAEAKERFSQLGSAPSNTPEMIRIKILAEIGLAICENQEGKSQEALEKLNGMIQKYDSTDQALFARLNNAKGACYSKMNKPDRALLSYLQTDLLFFTDPETHAEALYNLKALWPTQGKPDRAADAQARLVSQYASSRWVSKP